MRINYKQICYVFVLLTMMLYSSCKKETQSADVDNIPPTDVILQFANEEDFNRNMERLMCLSAEKKVEWNKTNDFVSFAQSSEDFYFSIDWEQFKSKEELEKFVEQHSNYLQMTYRDNDTYVEPRLIENPERYLMNQNRMYQIGNLIYKVFDDYKISTTAENIMQLKKINSEKDYLNYANKEVLNIQYYNRGMKSVLHNNEVADLYDEQHQRKDNGRNRTYTSIRIVCVKGKPENPNYMYFSSTYVEFVVRPYMKTLGIYYFCKRTITADIKVALTHNPATSNKYYRFRYNGMESVFEGKYTYFKGVNPISTPMFGAFDVYADTPSTDPVSFERNKDMLIGLKFEEY